MSSDPAEPRRPPGHGARNVLLLLGGGLAAAFAVIAVLTDNAMSGMLIVLTIFVLLFSYAIWVVGTDMIAPERWTPGTRRARLAVVALIALANAACCWSGYPDRIGMPATALERQPFLIGLLLILPKPANRSGRGSARTAGKA